MKRILVTFALMLAVILAFSACDMLPGNEPKEDVITVEDGYLVVNGVKTEHKVDDGKDDSEEKTDVIDIADGYLVVNGVKTEHKVYTEPVLSVIDGYVAVNGVKTDYKVYTDPVISVIDGYVAVNGVKTEYEVSKGCEHIWETVITYPTCTQEGYDTMTCSLCDKVVITNKTEKLEHNYSPTYTVDDNYHWFKCNGCDAIDGKENHNIDDDGACTACGLPVSATPGVVYDVSTDGTYAEVIGYEGTATKVKIASEYKGLPVKNIYENAFFCKGITNVFIPDSVTSIDKYAFYGCTSLISVTIPDSVTSIGVSAFGYCHIKDVYIYDIGLWCTNSIADRIDNIYLIEDGVSKLITELVIPNSVTSIGSSAFSNCESIISVTIPDSVTSIGDYAFRGCSSLTSVTIGNSVTSIGDWAFNSCSGLTSVTIGNSVTSIGKDAFYGCNSALYTEYEYGKYVCTNDNPYSILIELTNKNLSTYQIHEDTKIIGYEAFYECQRLASITIPDSVTSIGGYAFYGCSNLTSVTIGNSVTNIGWYAFSYCTSLTSITIPDSVTSIDWGAFYYCSSLTSINYDGTIEEWNAISKGSYWNSYTGNYTIYCTDGEI